MLPIRNKSPEDLKLNTKTSMPSPKQTIGMLCLLWSISDESHMLEYSEKADESVSNGITWKPTIKRDLTDIILRFVSDDEATVILKLNDHSFLTYQFEPLRMAMRFIWRLAEVQFLDDGRTNAHERNAGNRFPKRLCFTTTLDLLSLSFQENDLLRLAIIWAIPELHLRTPIEDFTADRFTRWMNLQVESTVFTTRSEGSSPSGPFDQNSVYQEILANGEAVLPKAEQMGPTRIFCSMWGKDMNPYVTYSQAKRTVTLRESVQKDELYAYHSRVSQTNAIANDIFAVRSNGFREVDNDKKQSEEDTSMVAPSIVSPFPMNRILSGAPGTGKSFRLSKDADSINAIVIRNVFYSGLRHSAFFGSLRPSTNAAGQIDYSFQPGPFIQAYLKALKHPESHVVLIIEEMNRADVSEVFGEVFQLLDRKHDGTSEYSVSVSSDCAKFLQHSLGANEPVQEMSLPSNLSIWSTINPADQSVTTLDSAFIRRWKREYLHIDAGENEIGDLILNLEFLDAEVPWNDLRKGLNEYMLDFDPTLSEDRLIGPFFVTSKDVAGVNNDDIFINQIMNYVINDALRFRRNELFGGIGIRNFSDFLARYKTDIDFHIWCRRTMGLPSIN